MKLKEKGCLVCGEKIKAKYLCSKHHQRYIRNSSVYLKGEVGDVDKVLKSIEKRPRISFSRFA